MPNFTFTLDELKTLLKLARHELESLFQNNSHQIHQKPLTGILSENLGVFVSLYYKGKLRGCIGSFSSSVPLYQQVIKMTRQAALNDTRFNPVEKGELNDIEIEISVLSPLERIYSIDDIELGKHGIYIKKDFRTGTFLPQVALKTNWSTEEFVSHCSSEKAGLGWQGWREAELYCYEAQIIKESEFFPKNA